LSQSAAVKKGKGQKSKEEEQRGDEDVPVSQAAPAIPQKKAPDSVSRWQRGLPVGVTPSPWAPKKRKRGQLEKGRARRRRGVPEPSPAPGATRLVAVHWVGSAREETRVSDAFV
jgi:hypothetical protein